MSNPYYPDPQDDEQDPATQFDQYDQADEQDPLLERQAQGSQPEWQSSNPNTQQDQWGQQSDGQNNRYADPLQRAAGQNPRPAPDVSDDDEYDEDDWMGNTSTRY